MKAFLKSGLITLLIAIAFSMLIGILSLINKYFTEELLAIFVFCLVVFGVWGIFWIYFTKRIKLKDE